MIAKETEAAILRLFHAEKWRVATIASELHVHYTTVQRVLRQSGVEVKAIAPRASVKERGYTGGPDHFRGSSAPAEIHPILSNQNFEGRGSSAPAEIHPHRPAQ